MKPRVAVKIPWIKHISWPTVVEGDPFSIATTPRCREKRNSFLWIAQLFLDPYLIMLSVKQGGINKYHFLSLWYDSTGDWSPVSRAIGEHSTTVSVDRSIYVYLLTKCVKEWIESYKFRKIDFLKIFEWINLMKNNNFFFNEKITSLKHEYVLISILTKEVP